MHTIVLIPPGSGTDGFNDWAVVAFVCLLRWIAPKRSYLEVPISCDQRSHHVTHEGTAWWAVRLHSSGSHTWGKETTPLVSCVVIMSDASVRQSHCASVSGENVRHLSVRQHCAWHNRQQCLPGSSKTGCISFTSGLRGCWCQGKKGADVLHKGSKCMMMVATVDSTVYNWFIYGFNECVQALAQCALGGGAGLSQRGLLWKLQVESVSHLFKEKISIKCRLNDLMAVWLQVLSDGLGAWKAFCSLLISHYGIVSIMPGYLVAVFLSDWEWVWSVSQVDQHRLLWTTWIPKALLLHEALLLNYHKCNAATTSSRRATCGNARQSCWRRDHILHLWSWWCHTRCTWFENMHMIIFNNHLQVFSCSLLPETQVFQETGQELQWELRRWYHHNNYLIKKALFHRVRTSQQVASWNLTI